MKKLVLSIALLSNIVSYAQKEEVDAAKKAYESGDYFLALTNIDKAVPLLEANKNKIEDRTQLGYWLYKGKALIKLAGQDNDLNKLVEGYNTLNKILDFEKGTTFAVKNKDTGDRYYFSSEEEMNTVINAGGKWSKPKSNKRDTNYSYDVQSLAPEILNQVQGGANKAYDAKEYVKAAELYETVAKMNNNDQFIYNAAISYQLAKENEKSFKLYKQLLDKEYTGVVTYYYAKQVATGQESNFGADKKNRDTFVSKGLYNSPREETTPDISESIYNFVTYHLVYDSKDYQKGIEYLTKGTQKFPNNKDFADRLAHAYNKSGNSEAFVTQLEENAKVNPTDATNFYNLGVLYTQKGQKEKAKEAYKKVIQLDSKNVNALLNLSRLLLDGEKALVDEMNALGTSRNEVKKYDKLTAKRSEMYKGIIPYLEQALAADDKNAKILSVLKSAYRITDNTKKYKETKDRMNRL